MALPTNNIKLTLIKIEDAFSTITRSSAMNFIEIEKYLNQIRIYLADTEDETVTQEQIVEAINTLRGNKIIPSALISGQSFTYTDGTVVSRLNNEYTFTMLFNTENTIVQCKNNVSKDILNVSIRTTGVNIVINTFTAIVDDMRVIYF